MTELILENLKIHNQAADRLEALKTLTKLLITCFALEKNI
jgi:hypothetical protein